MTIEVIVRMDANYLPEFCKKNGIEEYTWRKGQYLIDMTNMMKEATAKPSTPTPAPAQKPAEQPKPAAAAQSSLF